MLTEGLRDGTGLGVQLMTVEAIGQVTGVRGCGRERTVSSRRVLTGFSVGEMVERSSTWGRLSSFQIKEEPLLLGDEKGAALAFLLQVGP